MHSLAAYAIALATTFVINLPFGYWRQGLRKLSPAWFVAIHRTGADGHPVAVSCSDCRSAGSALPFFVVAYFGGQFVGSRLQAGAGQAPGSPVAVITNGGRSAGENLP